MKKILYVSVAILLLFGVGCIEKKEGQSANVSNAPAQVQLTESQAQGTHLQEVAVGDSARIVPYLGSDCKGNYVWAGAMNLAWNELNEHILHEKLKLNTTNKVVLDMLASFNSAPFTRKDLDEQSYYVKSGYGPQTLELINKESRKKFPKKSFEELKLNLAETDIISYAYLLKELEYQVAFEKKPVLFEGKPVEGFFAEEQAQKQNVLVRLYENEDKFILSLKLKEKGDQLFLAKGFDMKKPDSVLKALAANGPVSGMKKGELFEAPRLDLSHSRVYKDLLRIPLANKGFEGYFIAEMFENIKFKMDEKGARVENEAVIVATKSAEDKPADARKFLLDKPYWVIMKRTDRPNPYFMLGVRNTALMQTK